MTPTLGILEIVTSLIFLVCGILILKISYKKKYSEDYSLKNYFPSELVDTKEGYFFLFYVLTTLLIIPFIISLIRNIDFYSQRSNLILALVFSIFESVLLICFTFLFNITREYKRNLFCYFSYAVFVVVKGLMYSFILIRISNFEYVVPFTFGAISAVISIGHCIFLLNPKLLDWFKMNVTKNSDNEVTVCRPKFFILAFSQWLTIIIQFLINIVFIVGIFSFIY